MGYESLVGDMGSTLSGGQKQRVLIARALYRRPRVLILDEGTSHLDLENERAVNAALSQLAITRLVVAHSPETLRAAQRVITLEGGLAREVSVVLNNQQERSRENVEIG
jgi:ATP-binding cassette subfamily B protein RaxB